MSRKIVSSPPEFSLKTPATAAMNGPECIHCNNRKNASHCQG